MGLRDTLRGYGYGEGAVVLQIDTLSLYGARRLVWSGEFGDELVEGVGSAAYGPLGLRNPVLAEGYYGLVDYCVGSDAACNIVSTTSLKERLGVRQVSVYPVPAYDRITLADPGAEDTGQVTVSIYSITGGLLYSRRYDDMLPQPFSLSVGQLPTGTYLLEIRRAKELALSRFVKR